MMADQEQRDINDQDPLALAIERLGRNFADHPGFMPTAGGFEILHADWPAYPLGHGRRAALHSLTEYPSGTRFFYLDNIDRCTLFSVGQPRPAQSVNLDHLFVAIWDEDLRDLARTDLLDGLSSLDSDLLEFPTKSVELTAKADHLALVYELTHGLHPSLLDQVEDLLEIQRYDAAVREGSVILEQALRDLIGRPVQTSGKKLLDKVFEAVAEKLPIANAEKLHIKAEFRRFFAYVRNEAAHGSSGIDLLAACRALWRCSRLLHVVEALRSSGFSEQSESS